MINQDLINKLSDREKFCLEAYQLTKNKELAYLCSRPNKSNAKGPSLAAQVSRWFQSEPVQEWIKQYNETRRIKQTICDENNGNVDREELLRGLSISFRDPTIDERTRADIGLKIATLEAWKGKQDGEEESKIRYYMPLKCKDCVLYKNTKTKLQTDQK